MKILVTGSKGFIGRNLVCALRSRGCGEILECNTDTSPDFLERCCLECDFVFHPTGRSILMSMERETGILQKNLLVFWKKAAVPH